MKSERRHELQKNQLADWLAGVIEKIKPYQNAILGVVILAVAVAAGLSWWTQRSAGKEAEAWDQVFAVMARGRMEPGEFEDIVDKYPGTDVAHWAATMAGDLRLAMGCNALFENKAAANQELRGAGEQDGAVDHYLKVLEESDNPMLRERATFGLAAPERRWVNWTRRNSATSKSPKNGPTGPTPPWPPND